MIEIKRAVFPKDFTRVCQIFREYIASTSTDLTFQDYESELDSLPGKYQTPMGGIFLAIDDTGVVACAGFRKINRHTCEMKRVYVSPDVRGQGLGKQLIEHVLCAAHVSGYTRICLDVLPEFDRALQMYLSYGFKDAQAVSFNPVPGTRFLALDLHDITDRIAVPQ